MSCNLRHENRLRGAGWQLIAGIDEAGRGPLAGPVVAAAVILPNKFRHRSLNDSKKLTPEQRETIYEELTNHSTIIWACEAVHHEDIDRLNILRATHLAMRLAVQSLSTTPDHVLIDGRPVDPFPIGQTSLVGGDALSFSIAAASVIAKVTRDRLMLELDARFPEYGFAKHKGYATALHLQKLREHGPCSIHRYSFAPVGQPTFEF